MISLHLLCIYIFLYHAVYIKRFNLIKFCKRQVEMNRYVAFLYQTNKNSSFEKYLFDFIKIKREWKKIVTHKSETQY